MDDQHFISYFYKLRFYGQCQGCGAVGAAGMVGEVGGVGAIEWQVLDVGASEEQEGVGGMQ